MVAGGSACPSSDICKEISQRLLLSHNEVLPLPAGDPHGHGRFSRGDNDPDPGVAAASHGAAPGVHHEADQEPGDREEISQELGGLKVRLRGVSWQSARKIDET